MGIPEEDLPPAWIRDYDTLYDIGGNPSTGGDSGTGVKVDTPAMQQFASALRQNVDDDYNPHAHKVFDQMATPAEGHLNFLELWWALEQHDQIKTTATDNVANQGNGAKIFAHAAGEISRAYQGADAYSAAQLADVHKYLGTTPDQPATTTDPTTTPTNPAGGV